MHRKKRIIMNQLKQQLILLVIFTIVFSVFASGVIPVTAFQINEQCGDNLFWTLNADTGLLEINGSGDMWNWDKENPAPWYGQRDIIRKVYIHSNVTSIGIRAFADLVNLTTADMPENIYTVGEGAYDGAVSLLHINIYSSVSSVSSVSSASSTDIMSRAASNTETYPGLDLLLSGFNIFGGKKFSRANIVELIPQEGKTNLENSNENLGFMNFTGGDRESYSFFAASSMEALASKYGADISAGNSFGNGYENETDVISDLKFLKSGQKFKTAASYRYTQTNSTTSAYSYSNSYENFFSLMEITRELGRNHIVDANSLRTHNTTIWNELKQEVRNSLTTGDIETLFNTFGTHVITSYNFGGRAEQFVSVIKTDSAEEASIMKQMGYNDRAFGEFGDLETSLKASVDHNKNVVEKAEELRDSGKYEISNVSHVFGGDMGMGAALNPNSELSEFDNWLESVSTADAVNTTEIFLDSQLELVGIWELLPPEYEERKAEMQKIYLEKLRDTEQNFYEEYIYSTSEIVKDMPKPVIDDTYEYVSTPEEFNAIRNNLSGNYIITREIDLSGYANWEPVGSADAPFTGIIQGNGNTIHNVNVSAAYNSAPGLFGYNSGTINYLGAVYNSRFGGIAGVNNGTVTGCYTEFLSKPPAVTYTENYIPTAEVNTTGTVLFDFAADSSPGRTITLGRDAETVIFRGSNITGLNIIVQGDNTNIVFDGFNYTGGAGSSALKFTGTNPAVISVGSPNSISGRGNFSTIEAENNLYICGYSDFTVDHMTVAALIDLPVGPASGPDGAHGQSAVKSYGSVDIAVDSNFTARGGNGAIGFTPLKPDNPASPGGNASDGGRGGNGGNGGNGIEANKVNILNFSKIYLYGGNAGDGAVGGLPADGASGAHGDDGQGESGDDGGDGGSGGRGGDGGTGGTPLIAGQNLFYNGILYSTISSPPSYLYLRAGKGGKGGDGSSSIWGWGGNGGNGGTGQKKSSTIIGSGGRGGDGGHGGDGGYTGDGGDGGYNGSLEILEGISQNYGGANGISNEPYIFSYGFGGIGGTGGTNFWGTHAASGNSGLDGNLQIKGSDGISRETAPDLEMERAKGNITYINLNNWANNRLIIENTGKTEYYQHTGIFDSSEFKFSVKIGSEYREVLPPQIEFEYDFSKSGNTLVTAVYWINDMQRSVRYIPVKVVEPIQETPFLIKPQINYFYTGNQFNHNGLMLAVPYSDGSLSLVTDGFTVNPAAGTVLNEKGVFTAVVDHSEFEFTASYSYTVDLAPAVNITLIGTPINHIEGEVFNPSGMQFKIDFEDESTKTVSPSEVSFSHGLLNQPGTAFPVTVYYENISKTFDVVVYADPIVGIEIQPPIPGNLTNYFEGDTFNKSALKISAVRNSGRRTPLSVSELFIEPNRELYPADNKITLIYWDRSNGSSYNTSLPISVKEVSPERIVVIRPPNKLIYNEGDIFNPGEIRVYLEYNNKNTKLIPADNLVFSPMVLGRNDKEVIVTYETFNDSIPVTVNYNTAIELRLVNAPDKTVYEPGDLFDPSGLVVDKILDNGSSETITEFEIISDRQLEESDSEIMIEFENLTLNIPISVRAVPSVDTPSADYSPSESVPYGTEITLSCNPSDAVIRYTTDESEPTEETSLVYSSPIPITERTIIKAKAFKEDMKDSETAVFIYEVKSIIPNKIFDSAKFGYAEQTPYNVIIKNEDTQSTGPLTITLYDIENGELGEVNDDFMLSKTNIADISAGEEDSFTIAPKTGLSEGTYEAAVEVNDSSNSLQKFTVSFTVTKSIICPPPDSGYTKVTVNGADYIAGIESGVNAYEITNSLMSELPEGYTSEVIDINGNTIADSQNISTGAKIIVKDEISNIAEEAILVIKYDISGIDGQVGLEDIFTALDYSVGNTELNDAQKLAVEDKKGLELIFPMLEYAVNH